jgi:hypothetical protein
MILDQLRAGCDVGEGTEWTVGADSSVVRAHQHAAGARYEPPKDIPEQKLTPLLATPGPTAERATPASTTPSTTAETTADTGGWGESQESSAGERQAG